jgi:hypothetical protein
MSETWGKVWLQRHCLSCCFLLAAFLVVIAAMPTRLLRVRPHDVSYGEAASSHVTTTTRALSTGGSSSRVANAGALTFLPVSERTAPALSDRKIAITGSMDLLVASPADEVEKIRRYAESVGGYVETSQVSGMPDNASGNVTLLVPSARYGEVKAELGRLSLHVENERWNAQDVSKQYVDVQARLRNLRAQEAQYLVIMRSASQVKDMLDVAEKLSDVRGQIEETQAESEMWSKRVEMVVIAVSLRLQPMPESIAWNWQPGKQLKISLREAADGVADYATAMASTVLYLPVILLWMATIIVGGAVAWRILRWAARMFFNIPRTAMIEKTAN